MGQFFFFFLVNNNLDVNEFAVVLLVVVWDDELGAFELEADWVKESLASKLAVISLTESEAIIDNWSDRDLISRLLLAESLDEENEEEEMPDDEGVDSKLAVICLLQ